MCLCTHQAQKKERIITEMADNYLEKQYAEYEARKAAWEKERKFGIAKKKTVANAQPTPKVVETEKPAKDQPQQKADNQ